MQHSDPSLWGRTGGRAMEGHSHDIELWGCCRELGSRQHLVTSLASSCPPIGDHRGDKWSLWSPRSSSPGHATYTSFSAKDSPCLCPELCTTCDPGSRIPPLHVSQDCNDHLLPLPKVPSSLGSPWRVPRDCHNTVFQHLHFKPFPVQLREIRSPPSYLGI